MSLRPILEVASELGLSADEVLPYGRGKAKIELSALAKPARGKGRLVLVSAINPTPAGEGKTTTSIALAMGMRKLGKNAVLALREPSLGPVFGVKGGGTGGGKASLVPAEDINLHFTGDIHAITTAHNLLSALVDNAIYFRKKMPSGGTIDSRTVTWGRALDMNDRFLRNVVVGLGGKSHGTPREDRFDITAASEIMAIMALAKDHDDLEARLGRILVAQDTEGAAVTAKDVDAAAAMTAVLRDALSPNLVQTAEGGPAIVHCGPFANIAHGCNSVLATRLAMSHGDYAITEAGFGFDLGGEKFLDIKCRAAGIFPRAHRARRHAEGAQDARRLAEVKEWPPRPTLTSSRRASRTSRSTSRTRKVLRPHADRRRERLPERHRRRARARRRGREQARGEVRAVDRLRPRRGRRPRARQGRVRGGRRDRRRAAAREVCVRCK
jgi:formate--tetrahydrofolate ligase